MTDFSLIPSHQENILYLLIVVCPCLLVAFWEVAAKNNSIGTFKKNEMMDHIVSQTYAW